MLCICDHLLQDEFILMMQRIFRGKLSSNDDVLVKYRDEGITPPPPISR